jgi:hypothetical protein
MNRRALHGLLGSLVLAGLLAIGLAFTFAVDQPAAQPFTIIDCGRGSC